MLPDSAVRQMSVLERGKASQFFSYIAMCVVSHLGWQAVKGSFHCSWAQ